MNTTAVVLGVLTLVVALAAFVSWRRRKFDAKADLGSVSDQWMAELKVSRNDPPR